MRQITYRRTYFPLRRAQFQTVRAADSPGSGNRSVKFRPASDYPARDARLTCDVVTHNAGEAPSLRAVGDVLVGTLGPPG